MEDFEVVDESDAANVFKKYRVIYRSKAGRGDFYSENRKSLMDYRVKFYELSEAPDPARLNMYKVARDITRDTDDQNDLAAAKVGSRLSFVFENFSCDDVEKTKNELKIFNEHVVDFMNELKLKEFLATSTMREKIVPVAWDEIELTDFPDELKDDEGFVSFLRSMQESEKLCHQHKEPAFVESRPTEEDSIRIKLPGYIRDASGRIMTSKALLVMNKAYTAYSGVINNRPKEDILSDLRKLKGPNERKSEIDDFRRQLHNARIFIDSTEQGTFPYDKDGKWPFS